MKRVIITTFAVCLAVCLTFAFIYAPWSHTPLNRPVKVGFIYENDESTVYTHNFATAEDALTRQYGDRVSLMIRSDVPERETAEPLRELAEAGCDIIFAYTYSDEIAQVAPEYPQTQFCQISRKNTDGVPCPDNYHTFNAEIYQGRYVCGIAAGMKLRELIDAKQISADEALMGFVAAYPDAETRSAYTAFLLGARSVAPEATLMVRYTQSRCSYGKERTAAEALIKSGCKIIAQHSPTLAPAMACEDAWVRGTTVYHIGQDRNTLDLIPNAALVSVKVNWSPYVLAAVGAVMNRHHIENRIDANVHGSDVSAGFDRGWVQLLELNVQNAAPDTQAALEKAVDALRKGKLDVFKGPYTGANPATGETCDLSRGFTENARSSYPAFNYVIDGVEEENGKTGLY